MLPSRLKSKLRSELGFIAAELAILVVLLIGLASGSVLVQQSQNPEKKAAISLLSCNSGNCYQDCICQGNTPGECNAGCLPTPKPTESYTCNGDCIPDGENCWRSGTGTCQSNFFCCKQQDPDPTATPFYTPTRAPTRTPTRVPTKTPTPVCGSLGSTCQPNSCCTGMVCTYGICRNPSPTPSKTPTSTPRPTRTPTKTPTPGCGSSGSDCQPNGCCTGFVCTSGICRRLVTPTISPTPDCGSLGSTCQPNSCCTGMVCTYGICRKPSPTPTKTPTRTPTPACGVAGSSCLNRPCCSGQGLTCSSGTCRRISTPTPACISAAGGDCTTKPCCSDLRCTYGVCRAPSPTPRFTITPTRIPSPTPYTGCYD